MTVPEMIEYACNRFRAGFVAYYIGVTRSGLHKYRHGLIKPTEGNLRRIEDVYQAAKKANEALEGK